MKLCDLIEQAERKHCVSLTPEQKRDVRGRLTFADVDVNEIKDRETGLALDVILHVASTSTAPSMERNAALAERCPRCGATVSPVKLAAGINAAYCTACRIVDPET